MRRLQAFKQIFKKRFYIAELFVGIFIYFLLYLAITSTSKFLIISQASEVLIALLIITSAIILSVATFIIRKASKLSGYAGGFYSLLVSIFGSLFVTCGCQASILLTLLYFIGLNTIEVTWLYSALSSYNLYILFAFILVNLALLYYYLGKASEYTEEGKKEILSRVNLK